MTELRKREIAESFIASLRARDKALLESITTEDVVWTLPGESFMSGEAHGAEGILKRAEAFAKFHVNLEILHVLFGYRDVALSLHNTGKANGEILDEYLTTVIHLRDEKAHLIDTYISDVEMLNRFFV